MELNFNIIYTPGTAKQLLFFVPSLLKWWDCSFRLVANGCSRKEKALLQDFCNQHSRLEFFALPTKRMWAHGKALSFLQAMERSAHFCFMDSDILTTGDSLKTFTPHLDQYAACFSGRPLYFKAKDQILPDSFQRMQGKHSHTEHGLCLGSSFFAIYDNQALKRVIQETEIDFRKYLWTSIPPCYQEKLVELGVQKKTFDTGKLLNMLLLAWGEQFLYRDIPTLQHLGGISTVVVSQDRWRAFKVSLIARLPPGKIKQWMIDLTGLPIWGVRSMSLPEAEIAVSRELRSRKELFSRYFAALLQALFEDQALPPRPVSPDPEIEAKVAQATTNIINLYQEFEASNWKQS